MAVHLNTIPAQAGELMRALIEVDSGDDSQAWWLDARQDPATRGAVVEGSMDVAGSGGALARWRYRWGGVDNILINKTGPGNFSTWVAAGGVLRDKYCLIASDDTDPAIDVQIAFNDFDSAGGSFARIPLSSSDVTKLRRLTDNFNLLNIVVSDEPGSGPAPPPPPVTRDATADVEGGAPSVSAAAQSVPARVRDVAATIAAGAPGVASDGERVEPGEAGATGDVRAGAPQLDADVSVVPAGDRDVSATVTAGAPQLDASAQTVGVEPPSDVSGDVAAGEPVVSAEAEIVGPGATVTVQTAKFLAALWMPRPSPPRAIMPIALEIEGPAEDLVPALCRELSRKIEWCEFGETCVPSDAGPQGVIPRGAAETVYGGLVVSTDPNQSAPVYEEGDPEPSVSECRLLLTQPVSENHDDLQMFLDRRAELRRVICRLNGEIGS